jgi:hypothetical protein
LKSISRPLPSPDSTKQFAWPSKRGHRASGDVLEEVLGEDVDREVRDRAGLGGRDVDGVAEGEDVVVLRDCRVCLSTGT